MMQTDEQLMLEFQNGKSQAFEELFRRYLHPIYGFFRRRLTNISRAEDMAQETFMVILRGTERYEERAKFRTYLYAVALKLLWTERRRQLREAGAGRDAGDVPQASDPSVAYGFAMPLPDWTRIIERSSCFANTSSFHTTRLHSCSKFPSTRCARGFSGP